MRLLVPAALALFVALGGVALVYAADDDGDGFSNDIEMHVGSNPNVACSTPPDISPDWPPDMNNDTFVDISDISAMTFWWEDDAPVRFDVAPEPAGNGFMDISDIVRVTALFGTSCE